MFNRHDLSLKNTKVKGLVCPRCGSDVFYKEFQDYNNSHIEISCDKCLCTVAPCKNEEFKRAEKMVFSDINYKFILDIKREHHETSIMNYKDENYTNKFKTMKDIDYINQPNIYYDFGKNIQEWIYLLRYIGKVDKQ